MIVNSKLVRFVSFGKIEIAPGENKLTDEQAEELNAHLGFKGYVKRKEIEIIQDEEIEDEFDKEEFLSMSDEEIADAYTVKELKAICKDLGIQGYGKFKQDELILAIQESLTA